MIILDDIKTHSGSYTGYTKKQIGQMFNQMKIAEKRIFNEIGDESDINNDRFKKLKKLKIF